MLQNDQNRLAHWKWLAFVWLLLMQGAVLADELPPVPKSSLGNLSDLSQWSGLKPSHEGAILALPGEAIFRYPDGPRGGYNIGFSGHNDSTADWFNWYGVRFDVRCNDDRPISVDVILRTPDAAKDHTGKAAHTLLQGKGWHTVLLPWNRFDFPQSFPGFLHDIKELSIVARHEDANPGSITLRNAAVVRAETVWLSAAPRGQSVEAGKTADYPITIGNCTDEPQAVTFSLEHTGFQAMTATVEPASLLLAAGQTAKAMVRVAVPARIPPGGHETQTLRAISNGNASQSASLKLITAVKLEYPNILLTRAGWDEVREKVKKYEWAKVAQQEYVSLADKWSVPEVAKPPHNTVGDPFGAYLFPTQVEHSLMASGIAYQLTGDQKYAQKVRTFLLNLSSPKDGYPVTRRACHQSSVQEGHFFQHIAMAYDMTISSGIFSNEDRQQINETLRLFVGHEPSFDGNISNWSVSSQCGALYCSLVLQDLVTAEKILYDKGALIDQFTQGTLDDGWWYECSISYNIWCATEFSQMALAMRPWGYDLANTAFPSAFRPNDAKAPQDELYGMSRARWGPIHHNMISIKRMWDALPPMLDYRGMIFGLNDSTQKPVAGPAMDIAYYLYRDPAYATVIKRGGGKRDLLYGVPELPENTPDFSRISAFADNSGVVVLRSQTENRPQREQLQAVLHYGDHGWFHGHFDRTNLLHLSRYGRSFFNPEFIWYGYGSYLYKFYVQTSVNKNMVVVDQKMQEPVESQQLLFHSGKKMQVTAVQTTARWSNPPYGGMVYGDQPHKTFAEKCFADGRSIPVPPDAPKYGSVTDYTEPVLQRRLMVVTDDYVILADYLKAQKEHTFENVLQMREFQGIEATDKKLVRHTGQWNSDPLSSAQFVTDCDWYEVAAPARASFTFRFGPGADNAGTLTDLCEDGVLNMDVHTLWPLKQEMMIATPPESHGVAKQVNYALRGDGKTLTEGKSGIWILGQCEIDVPVSGIKSLELETQTGGSGMATLFWANARVVTADGKEIPITQLPMQMENIKQPAEIGKDYAGGPIKIAGIPYTLASPAQPQDTKKPAVIRVDLGSVTASRFKSVLGGDFPVGDETQRHKTFAVRSVGNEARFLTLIEPFESKRMVKTAQAISADKIRVELVDGRVQEIQIHDLKNTPAELGVTLQESREGQPLITETTLK